MNIISKISVKTIGCNPSAAKSEGKDVQLAKVYGVARGTINKVDQRGDPVVGLTGEFEAVNLGTGEVFRSGVLYLPSGIHEMVANSVKEGDTEFALGIVASPASNPIGYSYKAVPLLEPAANDPMAALRNKIAGKDFGAPQLPAPDKTAKTAKAG